MTGMVMNLVFLFVPMNGVSTLQEKLRAGRFFFNNVCLDGCDLVGAVSMKH